MLEPHAHIGSISKEDPLSRLDVEEVCRSIHVGVMTDTHALQWARERLHAYRFDEARRVLRAVFSAQEGDRRHYAHKNSGGGFSAPLTIAPPSGDPPVVGLPGYSEDARRNWEMSRWEYSTALHNGNLSLGESLFGMHQGDRHHYVVPKGYDEVAPPLNTIETDGHSPWEINPALLLACGKKCEQMEDWWNAIASYERARSPQHLLTVAHNIDRMAMKVEYAHAEEGMRVVGELRTLADKAREIALSHTIFDVKTMSNLFEYPVKEISTTPPSAMRAGMTFYYGGWSLVQLRDNPIVRKNNELLDQKYYEQYSWANTEALPGYYVFRVVPRKSESQMCTDKPASFVSSPACIAMTALLSHRMITGHPLRNEGCILCADQLSDGRQISIAFDGDGREAYGIWDEHASHCAYEGLIEKLPEHN